MKKPRGIWIAGNWKMNLGGKLTEAFFEELAPLAAHCLPPPSAEFFKMGRLKAMIFPPAIDLERAQKLAKRCPFPIEIASQTAHWEKHGAFTGELSGPMLQDIGITSALVGHSERRQYFGETDETVRKRSESLLSQGFQVILCIGETQGERADQRTQDVLARQIDVGISETAALNPLLRIAYEPVWAIGSGLTATPEQAEEAHVFIRQHLSRRFGRAAEDRRILYGGSVTPRNIDSILSCPNVDGGLVGGASLKPESFLALLAAGVRALD